MTSICAAALLASVLSDPGGYIAQRRYVLPVPFDQVVGRMTPEDNQRMIYEACDAELEAAIHEAMEVFPLPLRIRRRVRYRLRLPLVSRHLETVERVELDAGKMTVISTLARADCKVRQLDVKIVLARADDGQTHVSTYATMQVNGLGSRLGCLLSSITLERLECGLRQATWKPD